MRLRLEGLVAEPASLAFEWLDVRTTAAPPSVLLLMKPDQ